MPFVCRKRGSPCGFLFSLFGYIGQRAVFEGLFVQGDVFANVQHNLVVSVTGECVFAEGQGIHTNAKQRALVAADKVIFRNGNILDKRNSRFLLTLRFHLLLIHN